MQQQVLAVRAKHDRLSLEQSMTQLRDRAALLVLDGDSHGESELKAGICRPQHPSSDSSHCCENAQMMKVVPAVD